jgi:hypothetical protein
MANRRTLPLESLRKPREILRAEQPWEADLADLPAHAVAHLPLLVGTVNDNFDVPSEVHAGLGLDGEILGRSEPPDAA